MAWRSVTISSTHKLQGIHKPVPGNAIDQKHLKLLDDEWNKAAKVAGHKDPAVEARRNRPKTANQIEDGRRSAAKRVREKIRLQEEASKDGVSGGLEAVTEELRARHGGGKYQQARTDAKMRLRLRKEMLAKVRGVEVRELMGAGNVAGVSDHFSAEFGDYLKACKKLHGVGSADEENEKRRVLALLTPDYITEAIPGERSWMPQRPRKVRSPLNRSQRLRADCITRSTSLPNFDTDFYTLPNTMNWSLTSMKTSGA